LWTFSLISRLAEAEPLFRRALAIDEKSFGPDHPEVAMDLNNLAGLLPAPPTGLAEAEPLSGRHLRIFAEFGHILFPGARTWKDARPAYGNVASYNPANR
jgi:hypothetical protein